jgi:hypothetical protein
VNIPYWLRNLGHRARGARQELMRIAGIGTLAELRATHIDANGVRTDLGVISRRVVTTAGVAWLATAFTNTVEPETLNYHDCGTGTTAEAVGQTTLVTPYGGARATGTQSTPGSTNVYRSIGTVTFTGTLAITEHGIFTASSSGTLFDRSLFSAINVVNGDSIQFTWDVTFPSGG